MAKPKKIVRKTQEHFLPEAYNGRCVGKLDVDYVNGFPTFGKIKGLPANEILHKFEMRLPIPSMEDSPAFDEQCKLLYGYTGNELVVSKALEKLKTDLDELFKSYLFDAVYETPDEGPRTGISEEVAVESGYPELYAAVTDPMDAGSSYDPMRHIVAQEAVDDWRYIPRAATKTVTISNFINKIIASGRVKAEELEGIETQDQLFQKLAELGVL